MSANAGAGKRQGDNRSGNNRGGQGGNRGGNQDGDRSGNSRGGRGGNRGGKGGKGTRPAFDTAFQKDLTELNNKLQPIRDEGQKITQNIEAVTAEINALKAKQTTIRAEIKSQFSEKLGALDKERVTVTADVDKFKAQLENLQNERKQFPQGTFPVRRQKGQPFEEFRANNEAKLEEERRTLEDAIRHGAGSLAEEKQIVSSIEKNRAKKKQLDTFIQLGLGIDAARARWNQSKDRQRDIFNQINEIRAQRDQYKTQLKQISEQIDQLYLKLKALYADRTANNKQKKTIEQEKDAKRTELDGKWQEFKSEQAELKKKANEERKLKKQAEEEANKLKPVEEITVPLPNVAEVKLCDELLAFLKTLRYNKKKPEQSIKHGLGPIEQFGKLGLAPPRNGNGIEGSVAAVTQKRNEFIQNQQAEIARREAAHEAAVAKAAAEAANAANAANAETKSEEPAPAAPAPEAAAEPEAKTEEPAAAPDAPAEPEDKKPDAE